MELGTSEPSRLLLLLLLSWTATAAYDYYDDYTANTTDAADVQLTWPPGLCPRAMPSATIIRNDTVFLMLPAAAWLQLDSPLITTALPVFYILIFLVGLPSNALALWVLATRVEMLPSTIFLMNLAAADLLLGLLLPLKISYYLLGNHWPFGEGLCRFTTVAFYGNMYCSLLLLACISVDRHLAVAYPFFARSCRSTAFAVSTCAVVWAMAALFTLPLALLRQSFPLLHTQRTLCHDALPYENDATYYHHYFLTLLACGFLAPLLVLALCSGGTLWVLLGKGEKYATAIKLTALVLVSVVALYTPSHVLLLLHYSHACLEVRSTLYVAYMVSLAVSTCNSCVDPFIYYYVSEEFRAKVKGRLFGRQHRKGSAISLKTCKETLPTKNSQSLV
ncbi:proteinase-activated receptor 4 [Rhineura floridana]|uniref:proteinase-activated receptor 4 n=1 Tax=Rhineura floridana TaxID=261503 RepID=UPI002AC7EF9F|nr:proteinase-activated receptor 4 [Rhineura floridana]